MFGKFMNNYYYGKSGKGDYKKEDLPTNRWQLFWEMLRVRFSALMRLNLMYVVAWLPAMIVLMMGVLGIFSGLITEEGELVENAVDVLYSLVNSTLLLLVPCVAITGIVTPGVAYVTRNWSRDEHAFIWSDFKDAVKENWKQGVLTSVITGIMPLVVYLGWNFYGEYAVTSPLMTIPQVLVMMIGLLWAISVTYMHPLIVSYKLNFRGVVRNALLLAIARLPMSVGIRLLHMAPPAIALGLAFVVNPLYCVLGLFLYYLLIGFSLSRFVTASFTNGVFDRYINSRIEGAVVNRGLNTEADDDDYDEEEAEEE